MREGNLAFERSFARIPILKEQVFYLVDDIGIEPRLQTTIYLYLIRSFDWLSNGKAHRTIAWNDVWSFNSSHNLTTYLLIDNLSKFWNFTKYFFRVRILEHVWFMESNFLRVPPQFWLFGSLFCFLTQIYLLC